METNIKANGVIIYNLGKMDKKMVRGPIILHQKIAMRDISLMVKDKEKGGK